MQVVGDVSNGAAALDFLAQNTVDLAVVDLSMPVLSGLDFISESRVRFPNLQYVVLSFHEEFEYIQQALRLGALDYISKLRLDSEDCTSVFLRIRGLLDSAMHSTESRTDAAEEMYTAAEAESLSLFWLYDDEAFSHLEGVLGEVHLSVRQVDRLLVSTALALTQAFGVEVCAEHSSGGDVIALLADMRRRMVTEAEENVLPSTESCILRSVSYIRKHFSEPDLKAEQIAETVNMSRGYFFNNFRRCTGKTVNSYIRGIRIKEAKHLLMTEDLSVARVAECVGYRDEKYFARIFVEQVGVGCTEFRRRFSTIFVEGENCKAKPDKRGETRRQIAKNIRKSRNEPRLSEWEIF